MAGKVHAAAARNRARYKTENRRLQNKRRKADKEMKKTAKKAARKAGRIIQKIDSL